MENIGKRTIAYLKELVSKPATKATYVATVKRKDARGRVKIYKVKRTMYKGAPAGQPPRMRTGRLRRGIRYFVSNVPRTVWRVRVGSYARSDRGEPYPLFLETGWKPGGWAKGLPREKPRPYLKPGQRRMMEIAREELGARYSQAEFLELMSAAAREKGLAMYSHGRVPVIKMEFKL